MELAVAASPLTPPIKRAAASIVAARAPCPEVPNVYCAFFASFSRIPDKDPRRTAVLHHETMFHYRRAGAIPVDFSSSLSQRDKTARLRNLSFLRLFIRFGYKSNKSEKFPGGATWLLIGPRFAAWL